MTRLLESLFVFLQIVLIMDLKAAKNMKAREMACSDVQKVADSLNVNLTTNALDVFYNADVALVDVSITQQQPSLCYHIGVRESMGQTYNIILTHFTEETSELLVKALKRRHVIIDKARSKDSTRTSNGGILVSCHFINFFPQKLVPG
ncbi:unnamed protein product [Gongylonema pulchrum]|uniref:DUF4071 domain-containing protein n=1 Tax=Gongylonema pulchrum TaxID=637853 RepID=A0A183DC07_9BILA|nr:unnamed protein product [Gongylonema pulchrum]